MTINVSDIWPTIFNLGIISVLPIVVNILLKLMYVTYVCIWKWHAFTIIILPYMHINIHSVANILIKCSPWNYYKIYGLFKKSEEVNAVLQLMDISTKKNIINRDFKIKIYFWGIYYNMHIFFEIVLKITLHLNQWCFGGHKAL